MCIDCNNTTWGRVYVFSTCMSLLLFLLILFLLLLLLLVFLPWPVVHCRVSLETSRCLLSSWRAAERIPISIPPTCWPSVSPPGEFWRGGSFLVSTQLSAVHHRCHLCRKLPGFDTTQSTKFEPFFKCSVKEKWNNLHIYLPTSAKNTFLAQIQMQKKGKSFKRQVWIKGAESPSVQVD